jgi:hypothetical protein
MEKYLDRHGKAGFNFAKLALFSLLSRMNRVILILPMDRIDSQKGRCLTIYVTEKTGGMDYGGSLQIQISERKGNMVF